MFGEHQTSQDVHQLFSKCTNGFIKLGLFSVYGFKSSKWIKEKTLVMQPVATGMVIPHCRSGSNNKGGHWIDPVCLEYNSENMATNNECKYFYKGCSNFSLVNSDLINIDDQNKCDALVPSQIPKDVTGKCIITIHFYTNFVEYCRRNDSRCCDRWDAEHGSETILVGLVVLGNLLRKSWISIYPSFI